MNGAMRGLFYFFIHVLVPAAEEVINTVEFFLEELRLLGSSHHYVEEFALEQGEVTPHKSQHHDHEEDFG